MLNTSSSEDDEYDLSSGGTRNTNQDASGWRNYEYSGFRGLDLRSKPPDAPSSRKSSGAAEIASIYARFPAGPRARTTPSPVGCGGWQPLHVDSSSKPDSPRAIIGPQRPPRLSALSHPPHHLSSLRDQSAGHGGLDVRANTMASTTSAATGTGGQFSVSFEGISESGPIGTRLSPVGSSCWSSEQHISPDLNSLMSSSTNSVSAGLSLSSGRHTVGQGVYPSQTHPHPNTHHHHHQRPLQRQPSAGTGCSGGAYSIDHLKSTTHSVRSAPLCLGSPIEARCFRQLTLDVQTGSKGSGPTPPSLIVSDPEEELHQKRLQLYVFASRCVACPVLCPVSQGPTRRYLKVTKDYLMTLKERFQMFLKGEMTITCDEAFHNAISDFFEIVLESDRIASMVKSGSCSMYDIREVFITNIEKRFQTHQLIEGLSKESVVSAWKIKFDQICRGGERPCPVSMTLAVPQAEVTNPSKDQLYELLMRTLAIQKYEHQVLYNACQLDNADEQAAQLRRELAERLATIESMSKERSLPKLVHKEMESQFIDEEKLRVNELVRRLDSIPVLKGFNTTTTGPVQRRFRKNPMRTVRPQRGEEPKGVMSEPDSGMWSKQCGLDSTRCTSLLPSCSYGNLSPGQSMTRVDAYALPNTMVTASGYHGHGITREAVRLDFTIEILVCQLRNLRHLSPSKKLYCTIELEGNVDRKRTEPVVASKPVWDTTAEFQTTQPLPALKLKIFKESSGPLAIDDKELGKITLYPTWCSPRNPQWLRLQATKHCHDVLELQASISMQRPTNLKYANYCWIQGRTTFKKWKRRYICLTQVSQYTFVLAAYGEQKAHPSEFMALDGFTVDYCEARPDLISSACSMRNMKPDHHQSTSSLSSLSRLRFGSLSRASNIHPRSGSTMNVSSTNRGTGIEPEPNASFFFKLVREGDTVIVATANDSDRQNWVQAIYRATGQTHKPSLSSQAISAAGSTGTGGSTASKPAKDAESNRPGGLEDLALKPAHEFDQLELFIELQSRSLDQRLQDSFVSLGWPSPSQKIILEEYCARYGIRECQRHLAFLDNLLDKAEHGLRIDPDLIHLSYSLCANHVTGKTNHDQAVHTVLAAEREHFQEVKQRLTTLLERQITEFRYCFPFGRPEGALEKTIGLLERVLTKESGEPASADIVRNAIRICLRNAAVLNYERISEYATIEAVSGIRIQGMDATNERMQQMIHLAELCIEVLKQNEEHHAESFAWFSDLFVAHAENFWSLFQMDLFDLMDHLPDWRWEVFDLFQLLNDYLSNDANLCNGHFHQNLANRFDPLVDRYMELMSESIEQALITGYENEQWVPAAAVVGPGAASPSNNNNRLLNGATQIVQRSSLVKPPAVYTDLSPALSTGSSVGGIGKTQLAGSPRLARDSYPGQILGSTSGLPFTTEPFACPQSSSGMTGSSACQTVVELLWRLHKLKHFVQELSWPQPTKAKLLDERIRVLCAQMLREAVKRTLIELEISVRKCVKTPDLILPLECCTMLNTVTELRAHLFSLCHATEFSTAPGSPRYAATTTATTTTATTVGAASTTTNLGPGSSSTAATCTQSANQLHIETEEFFESVQRNMMVIVVDHFLIVLSGVLNKLTRFDENKLISSILTLTKPVDEEGRTYTNFINVNLQRLSQNLVDEVSMLSLCESWYTRQMRMIYEWLVHRKSVLLHPYQIKCLSNIVKKIFTYFELQGLSKNVLDTIAYQTVSQRLQVEETAHNVRQDTGSTSSSSAGKRKLLSALANSGMFNRG